MPELPEVETVCRILQSGRPHARATALPGHRITGSRLLWRRTLAAPGPRCFRERLPGQRIESVSRRGKFCVIGLTRDTLLFHLRMGGDLRIEPNAAPVSPHCRLILGLDRGMRLSFCNPRKFGRAWLTADPAEVLGKLGPEPLDPAFTAERFIDALARKRRQVKPLLLDQTFLAGLGNIYADEALHRARIHPLTRADGLSPEQGRALWRSIRTLLREAIRHSGTTFDGGYGGGEYFDRLRVYQRTGEACARCGTPIERILVGQRSTHFCPRCQALRRRSR